MARYLVTGVAGFIGSSLAEALLARGDEVRGIDNFITGSRANIESLLRPGGAPAEGGLADGTRPDDALPVHALPGGSLPDGALPGGSLQAHALHRGPLDGGARPGAARHAVLDFREADLRDAAAMRSACDGVEVVFHQGALPSVPRSVREPGPSHDANINGTFTLLEAARAAGVRRVLYAASSSAYGNQPGMPRLESMTPAPISPYAVQKLTGELYMKSYWQVYGLETVCLRYFNIFGPRQAPDSPYSGVIARFILQMLRGEQPTIFGDGAQGRDFTFIANAVSANLLAAAAPAPQVAGRSFNIACGGRHTLNETYGILARQLGFPHPARYGPPRAGDVTDSEADISAAREAFGYRPLVGFEEGLRRTVAWYREEFAREVGVGLPAS